MKPKILSIDDELLRNIEGLLRSAYEDLAEVDPADERSKVKLKRGKEDVTNAIKLISVVPWEDNQTMWENKK